MTGFFIVIYEIIYYSENPQTDYRWQIYSTILNPSLPLSILLKEKSKKKKKKQLQLERIAQFLFLVVAIKFLSLKNNRARRIQTNSGNNNSGLRKSVGRFFANGRVKKERREKTSRVQKTEVGCRTPKWRNSAVVRSSYILDSRS